jgi:hypothetical protein
VDISYFESGYIDPQYFTTVYDGEVYLDALTSQVVTLGNIVETSATLSSSFTVTASGFLSYRITQDPLAITNTNTGGASGLDGVSTGLGDTTYDYFAALKIDAGPLEA